MSPTLQQLSLPGTMLARGFWLYVWTVTTASGAEWLYVGRTGDSSSPNAQSPFARLSQHLGPNPKSNALRRNLEKASLNADTCRNFDLTAYGPVFSEETKMARHAPVRDIVAGLEKGLRDSLQAAGYHLLNEVHSRQAIDESRLRQVLKAFGKKFPKLAKLKARSATLRHRAFRGEL